MDPASFALALVTALYKCMEYGKTVKGFYDRYTQASPKIREALLQLNHLWTKLETQLYVL